MKSTRSQTNRDFESANKKAKENGDDEGCVMCGS